MFKALMLKISIFKINHKDFVIFYLFMDLIAIAIIIFYGELFIFTITTFFILGMHKRNNLIKFVANSLVLIPSNLATFGSLALKPLVFSVEIMPKNLNSIEFKCMVQSLNTLIHKNNRIFLESKFISKEISSKALITLNDSLNHVRIVHAMQGSSLIPETILQQQASILNYQLQSINLGELSEIIVDSSSMLDSIAHSTRVIEDLTVQLHGKAFTVPSKTCWEVMLTYCGHYSNINTTYNTLRWAAGVFFFMLSGEYFDYNNIRGRLLSDESNTSLSPRYTIKDENKIYRDTLFDDCGFSREDDCHLIPIEDLLEGINSFLPRNPE